MKNTMLKNLAEVKKEKAQVFQVMLLNGASEEVEVQEAEQIDFLRVQRHLKQGGSVFITSKSSQKLALPKKTAHQNKNTARKVTASYFSHV
jgi:hypothetical protein